MDLFRYAGHCQFDITRAYVPVGRVAVYFLHGGLHRVVGSGGDTWKLTWGLETPLEQFGQPIPGDPNARPLLVTEASARNKSRTIDGNVYLSHALQQLRQRDTALVVFGSSLSPEDGHLVDALNEHRHRPVAVSLYPGPKRDLARKQNDIFQRLDVEPLLFFDSTTHPLGSASLSAAHDAGVPGSPQSWSAIHTPDGGTRCPTSGRSGKTPKEAGTCCAKATAVRALISPPRERPGERARFFARLAGDKSSS